MRQAELVDPDAAQRAAARLLPPATHAAAREILDACGNLTRLQIVRALMSSPLAAGDLARVVGRSRAATSQHLAVLRGVRAVAATRRGNVVHYRLTDETSARILVSLASALETLERR